MDRLIRPTALTSGAQLTQTHTRMKKKLSLLSSSSSTTTTTRPRQNDLCREYWPEPAEKAEPPHKPCQSL